jgi:hypothetical protein
MCQAFWCAATRYPAVAAVRLPAPSWCPFFVHAHLYLIFVHIMLYLNIRGLRWSSANRLIPAAQYILAIDQIAPSSRRLCPLSTPQGWNSVRVWIAVGCVRFHFLPASSRSLEQALKLVRTVAARVAHGVCLCGAVCWEGARHTLSQICVIELFKRKCARVLY